MDQTQTAAAPRKGRKLRKVISHQDVDEIRRALDDLREVRNTLRKTGATKSRAYVARAIKSIQGALNHARRCYHAHRDECTREGISLNVLCNVELSDARQISTRPPLFFAIAKDDGHAVLHDNHRYYGYANTWHTERRGSCFRVRIFDLANGPDQKRERETKLFDTREEAHAGLIRMAQRATAGRITAADLQRAVNETQPKLRQRSK